MFIVLALVIALFLFFPVIARRLPIIDRIGRRRIASCVAVFLLLSFSAPALMTAFLGGDGMVFDPRLASPWVLVWTAVLLGLYFCFDGLRLHYVLTALGYRMSLRNMIKLVFVNILFSNITPMATGGGFAQIWYLRRFGVPIGTATAATTVRTLTATAFIFSLSPLVMLTLHPFSRAGGGWQVSAFLAIFSLCYLGFFFLAIFKKRWMVLSIHRFLALLFRLGLIDGERLHRWRLRSMREVIHFSGDMKKTLHGGRDISLSVLFSAAFLLVLFSFPFVLFRGVGCPVSYPVSVGLLVVTTFVMYFSPTPGGAGFAEGVFGMFFLSFVSPSILISIIIIWRFLTIYLGMIIGLFVVVADFIGEGRVRA